MPNKCPHCSMRGGISLVQDGHGAYYTCLYCGWSVEIIEPPLQEGDVDMITSKSTATEGAASKERVGV